MLSLEELAFVVALAQRVEAQQRHVRSPRRGPVVIDEPAPPVAHTNEL